MRVHGILLQVCSRLLRKFASGIERKFSDERWILIEIAVADPFWSYDEGHTTWPSEPSRSVRPCLQVRVLEAYQLRSSEFSGIAFVLHRLLACPADNERAPGSGRQIFKFPRTADRIENDLEIWSNSDANQR